MRTSGTWSMILTVGSALGAVHCSSSSGSAPGSGSQGTDVSSACADICSHEQSCGLASDVSTCQSNCASKGLVYPQWRSDFTADLTSCYAASDCSDTKAFNDCISQALLDIAPSSTDQSFCAALASAAGACSVTLSAQDCLTVTSHFSDASLSAANACTSMSCSDVPSCVSNALPGYTP